MRHVALCIFWPASFCFTNEMPEYEMHSEYEIYTHTNARVCVCVHVFRVFINCLQFADINLRNKFPRRTQTKESETESVKESKREKYFRPSVPQIFNEY